MAIKTILGKPSKTNFSGIYKIPKNTDDNPKKAYRQKKQNSRNLTQAMNIPEFTQEGLADTIQLFLNNFNIYTNSGIHPDLKISQNNIDNLNSSLITQLKEGFKGYEIQDYEELLENIEKYLNNIKELKEQETFFKSLLKKTNNNQEIKKILKKIEKAKGGLMNEDKKTELEKEIKNIEEKIKNTRSYQRVQLESRKQKLESKLENLNNKQSETTRLDIYEIVLGNLQLIVQTILKEKQAKANKNREKAKAKVEKRRQAVNDNLLQALNLKK